MSRNYDKTVKTWKMLSSIGWEKENIKQIIDDTYTDELLIH